MSKVKNIFPAQIQLEPIIWEIMANIIGIFSHRL